jgi:Na+-driven multidrug efflux pump
MLRRLAGWIFPDPRRAGVVLKLAAPVMAAMLTQTFINLFDTILIGFLPKEYSISGQAGLGYSVILHWLIGGFVGAISVGTQAMAARRLGEGDKEGAGRVVFNSALIALVAGTAVTVLAATFTRPLFRLLTSNEQVLAQGVPYCRARFFGILAMVGTLSFKSFFDGLGKTHYHLITAIVMNVINAVLAWGLVFGKLGLPRMNVQGAGVAATIASYFGLALMVGWALREKYRREYKIFRWSNFDLGIAGRIARLSVPSGVATVVAMAGFLVFFVWVGMIDREIADDAGRTLEAASLKWLHAVVPYGISHDSFLELLRSRAPVFEAATKVIIDILSISFMSCMGLGTATATLVSQNMGRRLPGESEAFAWTSVRIAAWFTGILGLIAVVFPDAYMGLFTHDHEVVEAGRFPLQLVGSIEFMLGFGMVLAQALFGAGNTMFVAVAELALHVGCLVPLSYLLGVALDFKLVGIFAAAVVYIAGLAVVMTWKFKAGSWKHIKI